MVGDVSALLEVHVVDFHGGLRPLEAVLVGEQHTPRHNLVPEARQHLLGQVRIVALTDKALIRDLGAYILLYFVPGLDCGRHHVLVEIWSIKISLIIFIIYRENRLLTWRPLQIGAAPRVQRTERFADAFEPGVDRLVVVDHVVVGG